MGDAAAITAAFGGGLPPGISGTNDRCTVLASNLNPDVSDVSYICFTSISSFKVC
jgi:polypyrimidine tract-binding protein 2